MAISWPGDCFASLAMTKKTGLIEKLHYCFHWLQTEKETILTSSIFQMAIAFTAGIGLGIFYFGGLWLTVRRLPTARRPALLSLLSFFGRLALVLLGFYLVMGARWERLLVCLLAFLGSRVVLVRLWGPGRTNLNKRVPKVKSETKVKSA